MVSSLGAMVRISLRRSRADWPIVLAAGSICLLAATLLAAASIYGSAMSVASLHRVLTDAPPADANIAVSTRVSPAEADDVDALVGAELEWTVGAGRGQVTRLVTSDSFALPQQPDGEVRDLAVLGYAEGLDEHAGLIDGVWPAVGGSATNSIPVAVSEQVAISLGLAVGDRLALQSRVNAGFAVLVEIGGIFRIDDPGAAFWLGDPQALDGVVTSERFVTHGPFFATREAILSDASPGRVELEWRAYPDADLTPGDVGALSRATGGLGSRLEAALGGQRPIVETRLPAILDAAERSLLVAWSGVLLLTIQVAVLAVYAVLLSASVLIEHRRVDTAMLRARGAGPGRIVGFALVEGLLLTVPAAVAAPWIAALAVRALNVAGPLAAIGLTIDPVVTVDAYVATGVAGAVCLAALTLPALWSSRSFAAIHGKLARGQTATLGQRLGLDVALLAVAAIGLWQLRLYGAPLTQSVHGSIGIDPLLVATPAIGLLAGAVVALRIVPLLAQLVERATARGRSLVPSLGARQLSRRPLRYTRAALLLILAMALGVFAVSYTLTWSASQVDQATFQVGADIRVEPGTQRGSPPLWALERTYDGLAGIDVRMPVERESVKLSRGARTGRIVAVDAAVAASVVHLRPDLSAAPVNELMMPLAEARPSIEAVRLPGEPTRLRLIVAVEIRRLDRPTVDDATGAVVNEPVEPSEIEDWRGLASSIIVRDSHGALYRFPGPTATIDSGSHELVVPLGLPGQAGGSAFAYPLDLFAVELSVGLPPQYESPDATITLSEVEATTGDAPWEPVSLDLPTGWRSTVSFFGRPHAPVDPFIPGGALTASAGGPGLRVLPGVDRFGRATTLTFAPAAISRVADAAIPIVASDPFLEATGSRPGEELLLTISGVRRQVLVTGSVRAFPGGDAADPTAILDLTTLSLVRFEGNDAVESPDEWWLAVDDGSATAVAEALAGPRVASRTILSQAERSRSLANDPVALGIIGALGIGFISAALFAMVGFVVSAAVSARERITEFALLRALGLSSGQLSFWLSLENAALAAVSLATGIVLGVVIAWVVLPFITVTQGAAAPYPPVAVEVPWNVIVALAAAGIVALGLTVIALGRVLSRTGLASVLRMSED
jgi:hypothetical protein